MKNMPEKTKKHLMIGIAVLVIVISAALVYIQASALSSLNSEIEEEEQAVEIARARLIRLTEHRANAAEYTERLEYATRLIPDTAGEEDILRYLNRLAGENELRVTQISFGARAEQEGYTVMPLSLTVQGSFQETRQLLRQLRNGGRAFRVDNVSISRGGEAGTALSVSVSANAFYKNND